MKLAEALQERADLNRRIEQLRSRLNMNATVQEGESPAEDPEALLSELNACTDRLKELICRINLTNANIKVKDYTLTQLLAAKDSLSVKVSVYRDFLNNASQVVYRASGREIKINPSVNVAEIQKNVDKMSSELRILDNKIQQANWMYDLI